MMKREVFQEGLAVSERPKKEKKKDEQVGWRQSQKDGSKEARKCYSLSKAF